MHSLDGRKVLFPRNGDWNDNRTQKDIKIKENSIENDKKIENKIEESKSLLIKDENKYENVFIKENSIENHKKIFETPFAKKFEGLANSTPKINMNFLWFEAFIVILFIISLFSLPNFKGSSAGIFCFLYAISLKI